MSTPRGARAPIAWAVYGGKTGFLRYVERDEEIVRSLVEDGGYAARPLYEATPPADDAEVLRAKAAALTEFADAVRMPFTVFRGDNEEPITPGDLMRETAARYLAEADKAARS